MPDWPSTFGHNMILFPWSRMVGGILYEHSHRLMGALVGLLTLALAGALWREGGRLRRLGLIAVVAVVVQGLLGGLRVVLLADTLAIFHGVLAQAFFALLASIALPTAPRGVSPEHESRAPGRVDGARGGFVYLQIVFGALLTHAGRIDLHLAGAVLVLVVVPIVTAQLRRTGDPVAAPVSRVVLVLLGSSCCSGSSFLARFSSLWIPGEQLTVIALPVAHRLVGSLILAATVILAVRVAASRRGRPRPGRSRPSRVPPWARRPRGPRGHDPDRAIVVAAARDRRRVVTDLIALTKPRVVLMILVTTVVGYYVGLTGAPDYARVIHLLIGTLLAAGGTLALNQYWERDVDARMERTRVRPLPDGRLAPLEALLFGSASRSRGSAISGRSWAGRAARDGGDDRAVPLRLYAAQAADAALHDCRRGAGRAAARDWLGRGAGESRTRRLGPVRHPVSLAAAPHPGHRPSLSRRLCAGGRPLLPVVDAEGTSTERQIVTGCLALLAVSLLPTLIGLAGPTYFVGAFVLGTAFVVLGTRQASMPSAVAARRVLFASLLYLPVLLALLAFDKV